MANENNKSFLQPDDIELAKEWTEGIRIPWRTGGGWRSTACRFAHEVERLERENARLLENEKLMNDQICVIANEEGRIREALVDLADLSRDRRTTRLMLRDRIAAILLPNV